MRRSETPMEYWGRYLVCAGGSILDVGCREAGRTMAKIERGAEQARNGRFRPLEDVVADIRSQFDLRRDR